MNIGGVFSEYREQSKVQKLVSPRRLGPKKPLHHGSGLIQAWTMCLPVRPSHLSSSRGRNSLLMLCEQCLIWSDGDLHP